MAYPGSLPPCRANERCPLVLGYSAEIGSPEIEGCQIRVAKIGTAQVGALKITSPEVNGPQVEVDIRRA